MFNNVTLILLIISVIVAAVCTLMAITGRKKVQPALAAPKSVSPIQLVQTAESEFPEPLIDRSGFILSDGAEITVEREAPVFEAKFEPIDDRETVLLKAAEIVVEKVQDVITHIASNPPNPEEVTTKIKSIVSPYGIFQGTEYFDAINSFIAISVERDCNIQLKKEDLLALWN